MVIPSSGHFCKGTVERPERDIVRVIGWPTFNELKARGRVQEFTKRVAALERLYEEVDGLMRGYGGYMNAGLPAAWKACKETMNDGCL